jgi:broad specificity phosphatase PhoE
MNDIIFIRHAETDMAGTFCGHSDPAVNTRGDAQIVKLLESRSWSHVDAVYCSDLKRAVRTARAIAKALSVELEISGQLREIYFGAWEGMTWKEVERNDPNVARQWLAQYPSLPAPQGEPFSDFEARVLQEVTRLRELTPDRRIAVVTHAGVMRVILRRYCNASEEEAWSRTKAYSCWFELPSGAILGSGLESTLGRCGQ